MLTNVAFLANVKWKTHAEWIKNWNLLPFPWLNLDEKTRTQMRILFKLRKAEIVIESVEMV